MSDTEILVGMKHSETQEQVLLFDCFATLIVRLSNNFFAKQKT